eukprot:gene20875-27716_t
MCWDERNGVVGSEYPRYFIFGETVRTAIRLATSTVLHTALADSSVANEATESFVPYSNWNDQPTFLLKGGRYKEAQGAFGQAVAAISSADDAGGGFLTTVAQYLNISRGAAEGDGGIQRLSLSAQVERAISSHDLTFVAQMDSETSVNELLELELAGALENPRLGDIMVDAAVQVDLEPRPVVSPSSLSHGLALVDERLKADPMLDSELGDWQQQQQQPFPIRPNLPQTQANQPHSPPQVPPQGPAPSPGPSPPSPPKPPPRPIPSHRQPTRSPTPSDPKDITQAQPQGPPQAHPQTTPSPSPRPSPNTTSHPKPTQADPGWVQSLETRSSRLSSTRPMRWLQQMSLLSPSTSRRNQLESVRQGGKQTWGT